MCPAEGGKGKREVNGMNYRKLGNSELEVSPVMLGSWAMGGWLWGGTERNRSEEAILASIDAGINGIDTAPVYGFGLSEEIVGKAIKHRDRDRLIVATKCGLVWDDRAGATPFFDTTDNSGKRLSVRRCLRKESIVKECEESLRRQVLDALEQVRPIAERYDATLAQVAVAWIFSQPGATAAIVGARNPDQAKSNALAADIELAAEDVEAIRSIFEPLVLDEPFDVAKVKR